MTQIFYDFVMIQNNSFTVTKKHINLRNVMTGWNGCHDEIDVQMDN